VFRIPCPYSSSVAEFDYSEPVKTTGSYSATLPYYKHQGYHTNLNAIRALSVANGISASVNNWSGNTLYDDFSYDFFVPMYGLVNPMGNSFHNMQLMNIQNIRGISGFNDYCGRKDIRKTHMP